MEKPSLPVARLAHDPHRRHGSGAALRQVGAAGVGCGELTMGHQAGRGDILGGDAHQMFDGFPCQRTACSKHTPAALLVGMDARIDNTYCASVTVSSIALSYCAANVHVDHKVLFLKVGHKVLESIDQQF